MIINPLQTVFHSLSNQAKIVSILWILMKTIEFSKQIMFFFNK